LLSSAVVVLAGNLDPPSGPTDAASQMHTLEQIYQRLNAGTEDTKMTSFTEPASGPGTGTMHTLDDIMGIAPAADNTNGALPAEVLAGKTFWSLRTNSAWGLQTGTAVAGDNVDGVDGSKTFDIPDGFYSGKTATANDKDLLANNIKSGIDILGVTGTCGPCAQDLADQVLHYYRKFRDPLSCCWLSRAGRRTAKRRRLAYPALHGQCGQQR
jgi:hypothetical protein